MLSYIKLTALFLIINYDVSQVHTLSTELVFHSHGVSAFLTDFGHF